MSYLLWGCLLLTVCVAGQTRVYGQRIQEVQSESADPGNGPIAEPKPALDLARIEHLIFTGTNLFRTQEKRAPLKINPELAGAAQAFAEYLAHTDKFSHTADGKEPWDRTTKVGYQNCIILENIAYEYNSAGFTAEVLAKIVCAAGRTRRDTAKTCSTPMCRTSVLGLPEVRARDDTTPFRTSVVPSLP